jgi:hypothetical protein
MIDRNLTSLCAHYSAADTISHASAHFNWINAIETGAGMHSTGFEFGIAEISAVGGACAYQSANTLSE